MKTIKLPALFFDQRSGLISAFEQMAEQMFNDASFPMIVERLRPLSSLGFPKVDVVDYPDKMVIYSDIPGYKKEDISIKVEEHVLTVSGKVNQDKAAGIIESDSFYRKIDAAHTSIHPRPRAIQNK